MGKFSNVLIVTDLDGTLLNSKKEVDPASREAIQYFIREGGYFTFATGRLYQSFTGIAKKMVYNAPIIFANGAQIISMGSVDVMYQQPLEDDILPVCEEVLERFPGAAMEIYAHRRCDIIHYNAITCKHMQDFTIEHTFYKTIRESAQPWLKVLFTERHEVLEEIAEFLRSRYDKATVCFSSPVFLEVFNKEVDKGRGIQQLAKILGVPDENIYASGDQENDLPMSNATKLFFAPENAVPAVKEKADVILPDNDHDMMAALINHLDSIY